MVFDITSDNMGAVTAACISIQIELGRELLWNAGRHHIGEVILTHVWDDLKIEVSKSQRYSNVYQIYRLFGFSGTSYYHRVFIC